MTSNTLQATIGALLQPGKGILAADESFPTIGKRFSEMGIPSTVENRRDYRELLFTAPGLASYISGVILFDETLRQRTAKGVPMAEVIASQGIVVGIKVDAGTDPMPAFPGEKMTLGLDGLRERLTDYYQLGARFTKWRAVISIGDHIPTSACIEANAHAFALFAGLCQEAGLVPIVEPEILMEGNHTMERCEQVATEALTRVFAVLSAHHVVLENMLLKTGMVLPGTDSIRQVPATEVANATLRLFRRTVPAAVPGIVFLSGGQEDVPATQRLDAICKSRDLPWRLTFSFGRALQDPALRAWAGSPKNVVAAQSALLIRARANGLAVTGNYSAAEEDLGASEVGR